MEPMHITLSDELSEFVAGRVSEGGFDSATAYIRQLVEADRRRATREWLEAELIKGLDSGEPIPVTPAFWQELHRRVVEPQQD